MQKIYGCGTVRVSRKGSDKDFSFVKKRILNKGLLNAWCSTDPVVAYMWFYKRPVYILSTIHNVYSNGEGGFSHVKRKSPWGVPMTASCPEVAVDYIKYMGGVDRRDQMIRMYNGGCRTKKKWWKGMCPTECPHFV
jgi:hypothetical protein